MEIGQGITGMGPQTTDATGSSALGKDEFVKLLMTQMQNQDPTSPQDSEAFVAQLAQFAQVELAQAQSARLEAILVAQAAGNQLGAAQLVGKEVTLARDTVTVGPESTSTAEINLGGDAELVTVKVTDEDGKEVASVNLGNQPAGPLSFKWDGETNDGKAKSGVYKLTVVATNAEGKGVDTSIMKRARVDGVTYQGGIPMLLVGGEEIPLAEILGVHAPGSGPGGFAVGSSTLPTNPTGSPTVDDPRIIEGDLTPSTEFVGLKNRDALEAANHEIWMQLSTFRNRTKG